MDVISLPDQHIPAVQDTGKVLLDHRTGVYHSDVDSVELPSEEGELEVSQERRA